MINLLMFTLYTSEK